MKSKMKPEAMLETARLLLAVVIGFSFGALLTIAVVLWLEKG